MPLPPEGRGLSSDCPVVSETDSAAKSQKTVCAVVRRKKAQLSPFKVPDSNSILLLSANEKRKQKEEKRKFLTLPIQEKTAKLKNELVGEVEEEEEEGNEKKRTPEQIKSKIVLPKQTSGRHELKIAMMKGENITKQSRHYLMSMERQKRVLELTLKTKRSEILKMDRAISKEDKKLKGLEKIIERENRKFEEFLRENERKSVEARILFEREEKSKQEMNCEIKKLTAQIGILKNDIAKLEEILTNYKGYKDFLFKLSPPAWQNEQKSKAVKPEVVADEDGQDDQHKEPDEIAIRNGLESKPFSSCGTPPSSRETRLPSAHIDILDSNFKKDCDISDYEEDPELYFTDPKQLLHLMTELTDQNLSLIQNSARLEEPLEVLQQSKETTKRQIEKDEKQIEEKISYINKKIEKEKARGAKLQQKIQFHVSLNTEDHNKMLEALSEKVTEVHSSCVDDRMINLSTLEKVANIENFISLLLEDFESIPEETLQMMRRIKKSEKRSKQREKKLREQREKQEERMRRYPERSLADAKKTSGRKLMPRSMPVIQRVRNEEDIHEYLFGSEDTE